jgi:putative DNA primase/helicase
MRSIGFGKIGLAARGVDGCDVATLVPFEQQFDDASRDNDLMLKLRNELPGILTWAVEGCLDWQRDGLGVPDTIRDAMTDYRNDQDIVGRFLDECCEADPNSWVPAADLYEAYRRWSVSQGESLLTQRQFGMRLSHRGQVREKLGPQRRWAWRSLALTNFNQPPF